ncbi:PEP-CTERM sorting domain-containing protein [Cerasicoccus maritimus]|uniref:PEP-CTERM sorting domain-containing protein n=1 Tax=Cerasicoccus maritimus TaxID=490089 RepID=UPI0028528702|nr:PEP-CTERM sorting domain-containing protein [Cerasicoccus maritimus]
MKKFVSSKLSINVNNNLPEKLLPATSAFCLVTLLLAPQLDAQLTVFSDNMDYVDTAALQSAYSNGFDATPTLATQLTFSPTPLSGFTPTPASGSSMSLGNGVRYRDLSQTVTGDWTLSFLVLSTSYSRGQSIFLLNASGTEGYGVGYQTALVNQFGGEGFVSIRKFDNNSATNWSSFGNGTQLASGGNSGNPVTGYEVTNAPDNNQNNATYDTANWQDMLEVTLTWDSSSGALTAFADGVEQTTITDTDFNSFSRIYIRGNTSAYFDSISVTTVPEPSTTALIVGISCIGLLGLVNWKKRRG